MTRWTHKVEPPPNAKTGKPCVVDPHYQGNGLPAYWLCYGCRTELLLDGGKVPLTAPVKPKTVPEAEPSMGAQP